MAEFAARAYCAGCLEGVRRGYAEGGKESGGLEAPLPSQAPYPAAPGVTAPREPGEGAVAEGVVVSCAFHPGVRAVTRCGVCGAFICAGCQRMLGDRRVCQYCLQHSGLAPQAVSRARGATAGAIKGPSLAAAPWKLWPGLVFLPLPFALSGLMSYMMRAGEEVSVGAAQLLLSLLLYSTMLLFVFMIVTHYGPGPEEVGFRTRNLPNSIALGFIGGVVSFWSVVAAGAISSLLFDRLGWLEEWLRSFFDVNVKTASGADLIVAGAVIIIAAPICEEIFFRGYLYPAMRSRLGVWGAVFLNGFLFSAVHFSLFGLIGRTLAGIIFCLLYEHNDNLWSPITAHALNNFVAFFLPLVVLWGS